MKEGSVTNMDTMNEKEWDGSHMFHAITSPWIKYVFIPSLNYTKISTTLKIINMIQNYIIFNR